MAHLSLLLFLAPVALVPQLGHRAFRQREAAHRTLAALGRVARPALEGAAGHPDPEVRQRAERLRAPWAEEVADQKSRRILPRHYPRLPWITDQVLPPAVCSHYLERARKGGFKCVGPYWPDYREATRLYVKSLIYQKRPRREVLDVLDLLAAEERLWIRTYGADHRPPVVDPRD